tara:strand:+ start:66 stop:452 length:387 start_codon:yes stop_codon:yes gene_type:complete
MKEQELFNYLSNKYISDLTTATSRMSRWDCVSDAHKVRIELKCRKTHYDTLLLEKKKYDAMISSVNGSNYRPLYINSTPKGIYSFDLLKIKPKWITNNLNPATTDFSNNSKVTKEVAYLSIKESTEIK